jgi:drug/metabolite transporter (DMT)-like permease
VAVGVVVAAGTIFYYEGMKRIKAAQVSALELSTPFFAVLLSLSILGESVTRMQLGGVALLAGGIYCLSRKEAGAEMDGRGLAHEEDRPPEEVSRE